MVFKYNRDFPEINPSIDLANAYIKYSAIILSDFAGSRDSFLRVVDTWQDVSVVNLGNSSYARLIYESEFRIELNMKYIERIKDLETERMTKIDNDEWVILLFFIAIDLFTNFAIYWCAFKIKRKQLQGN
jgi:hypothetical protein